MSNRVCQSWTLFARIELLLPLTLLLGSHLTCSQVLGGAESTTIDMPSFWLSSAGNKLADIRGGFTIPAGQCYLLSTAQRLCMQIQGNLVLYENNVALWATNLYQSFDVPGYRGTTYDWSDCRGCYAAFQPDGNLILYNPDWNSNGAHEYWASGTAGNSGAILEVSKSWPYLAVKDASGLSLWPRSALSYSTGAYFVKLPAATGQSLSWDQVPQPAAGAMDLFIGRRCINSCNSRTTPPVFNLIVASMNWNKHTLTVVNEHLFAGPQMIVGGYEIRTGYDPTVFWAQDEIWVSFECSDWRRLGAATCMGPIVQHGPKDKVNESSGRSWHVDPLRTTVVVRNSCDGTYCHSASSPKIFFWHGVPYMYYTAVHSLETKGTAGNWTGASTWGIRLQEAPSKVGKVYWAAGIRTSVDAADSNASEVMPVDPIDPSSNQFADGSGVYALGIAGAETALIMTGELGGNTNLSCLLVPQGLNPASNGCYRQFIAKATIPLGTGIYNSMRVSERESFMPSNLSQYVRRFFDHSGRSMLWGFYSVASAYDSNNAWTGPSDTMWAYPLNLETLTFQGRK